MENEKLKISISPITIEIEAPSGLFAQRPSQNPLLAIATGLLSGLIPQTQEPGQGFRIEEEERPTSELKDAPIQKEKKTTRASRKSSEDNAATQQEAPQQEAPQQEAPQQEAPRYTMVDVKSLSGKKDDRNPNPGGTRFMIREQLGKFGCTVLGELKEENFAEMMDFLSTLPDAK